MPDVAPLGQKRYVWDVTPETALDEQIKRYRAMSGEQRLKIALDLHELACDVARAGIRRQNPNASEKEVENLLRQRIALERELKLGRE